MEARVLQQLRVKRVPVLGQDQPRRHDREDADELAELELSGHQVIDRFELLDFHHHFVYDFEISTS
jgi:hypothetical protein